MEEELGENAQLCYEEPTVLNIFVGVFLITGITISYIPQYVAIIRARSSDGINFGMLALSLLSAFLSGINAGVLNWPEVVCCLDLTTPQCFKNNLSTEQIFSGLICTTILYTLFLVYFKTEETKDETHETRQRRKNLAMGTYVGVIVLSIGLSITAGVLYYNVHLRGSILQVIAKVLGLVSAVLIVVQWTPQIYTTYKMKSPGSLSVLMLILQIPGSLLVMFFQAFNHKDITIWLPYVFQFLQQSILVVMCVIFAVQDRMKKKKLEEDPYDEEQTLLATATPSD